ncbi:subtilisin-like protein [Hyaloscypha variabilis F]|uniref:tripeptidyl-peptidase II n=1 Tax=Hyaloscypha variabilis (strain UAMH 11265 / GT02V1 / F) TaxID=1149755 RepID=A0A2J6R5Q7_HYAVF|nr:subtilisin-like protein [Hyaloscypha variabilis F]
MFFKAALVAAVLSQSLPVFGAVHEKLHVLPVGWAEVTAPHPDTSLTLTIGLAQQNLDQLEPKLLAVSTPGNAEYGNHLDADAVNALFAPAPETITAVESWLQASGISQMINDGHFINFATTVGNANSLLNTTFLTYQNSGVSKIRAKQYSIPDDLVPYIDLVSPVTYFGKAAADVTGFTQTKRLVETTKRTRSIRRKRDDVAPYRINSTRSTIDASCQQKINLKCLQQLYNIGSYVPNVKSGSRIGFGSFLNQSALYADNAIYEQISNITAQNFTVKLISNATNDQDPVTAQIGEANLDVENIIGISHPLPVTEFITGGSPPFIPNVDQPTAADNQNEPYLPYYQYLLSQPNWALPQVISNSYGDDEQSVPYSYAVRVCNMIGMLGLRGITVLESAGDTGVGSACMSNDGTNTTQFTPQFPGSCPYVLSVGGTQGVTPEIAWKAGSGGFSNYFRRPWYQQRAVGDYLWFHIDPDTKDYYDDYTDFHGRGFPDISAHSLTPDYAIVYDGTVQPSGGTSAAAPVVAGILALLNDARFRVGKGPLGFINPWLYSTGWTALNDITNGTAVGCTGINGQTGEAVVGGGIIPYATWNATKGWDPVTGLGTPNFQLLKRLVVGF